LGELPLLKGESEEELLRKAGELLDHEPKLIELRRGARWAVFVGDTHGDLEASRRVIARYLRSEMKLIFLGDYVDRGPHSRENIRYLLEQKLRHPEQVFLLQGNHEGWKVARFSPADFWEGLPPELAAAYAEVLVKLPLAAVTPSGVIALHGALPDVPTLHDIDEIEPGSAPWRQITWGDWQELPGRELGELWGRPRFGRRYFEELMERFGRRVLIRSHQPDAPPFLFDRRCVTIFTSSAYGGLRPERTVALAPLQGALRSGSELILETV